MVLASNCFFDAPNLDGVLGCIIGRRPSSHERPRWDVIKYHLSRSFSFVGRPNFVLNRRHVTDRVFPLLRFLRDVGIQCQLADKVGGYPPNDDPVDEFILDRLADVKEASKHGEVEVAVMSHDHIYAPILKSIADAGGRVVICGFREELSPALLSLEGRNCEILYLEHDLGGFTFPLPRPYRPNRGLAC